MRDEPSMNEHRYLDAYAELEAEAEPSVDHGAVRDRVLAAAFDSSAAAPMLEPRRRRSAAVMLFGFGMAGAAVAAVAIAWVATRSPLDAEPTSQALEQAPLMLSASEPTHEVDPHLGHDRPAPVAPPAPALDSLNPATASPAPDVAPPKHADTPSKRSSSHHRAPPSSTPEATTPPELDDTDVTSPLPSATLKGAEVSQLEHARRLSRGGRYHAALDELRDHARTYPNSLLSLERDAERVVALCRLDDPSASDARSTLVARNPPRYLVRRVTRACDATTP